MNANATNRSAIDVAVCDPSLLWVRTRLVEKKRGNATLPQILRRTIYDRVSSSAYLPNGGREESLFVQDEPQQDLASPSVVAADSGTATKQASFGAFGATPQPKTPKTQGGFVVEPGTEVVGNVIILCC